MQAQLGSRASVQQRPARVQGPSRARLTVRAAVTDAFQEVRPYTLRKGDTIDSIAKKRGMTVQQVLDVNPDLNAVRLQEGNTILLPTGKLSKRDLEILSGIGTGYRLYPVRAGESLSEIMSKRKIQLSELQALNPGVNLNRLAANQMIKLPADKFTVREREMLMGIVPREFFEATKNPFVVGISVLLGVCGFVLAWMSFYRDPDFADEDEAEARQKA